MLGGRMFLAATVCEGGLLVVTLKFIDCIHDFER